MKQLNPDEMSAALLRISQGLLYLFVGFLLWFALWVGTIQIPMLDRFAVPRSTPPAILWFTGAWIIFRAPAITPAWTSRATLLLFTAALQLYLIPYLGWWHNIASPAYRAVNNGLILFSAVAGLLVIHLLIREIARSLKDTVLQIETYLSFAAAILIFPLMTTWLVWRVRGNVNYVELYHSFVLLWQSSGILRTGLIGITLLSMLPPVALLWEARQRIHHWLSEHNAPKNPA